MLTGPNIKEIRLLAEGTSTPVVASGGVSNLIDIQQLLELEPVGVVGVIVGKALYSGSLDLGEAIGITQSPNSTQ